MNAKHSTMRQRLAMFLAGFLAVMFAFQVLSWVGSPTQVWAQQDELPATPDADELSSDDGPSGFGPVCMLVGLGVSITQPIALYLADEIPTTNCILHKPVPAFILQHSFLI